MQDQPTGTDPYKQLHDDLREVADRIASLTGSGLKGPNSSTSLYIMPSIFWHDAAEAVPAVDAIAQALGVQATNVKDLGSWERLAVARIGSLRVKVYCPIPMPPDSRDARIAELEAELAAMREQQGGAQ